MKCSFCGTPRYKVKKLVAAGPRRAICDECILEAAQQIADESTIMISEDEFLYGKPADVVAH